MHTVVGDPDRKPQARKVALDCVKKNAKKGGDDFALPSGVTR